MPSQSPMKGSTKYSTSARAISAGGAHQRQADQKYLLSGVFVVRDCSNELSQWLMTRNFGPLNHLYAITLRIVLNFVHDVVDEEHAST